MFNFIDSDFMSILLGSGQMIHVQIPFFFDLTPGGLVHRLQCYAAADTTSSGTALKWRLCSFHNICTHVPVYITSHLRRRECSVELL